ncbi:EAL domain-containing protein [Aureimonas altamirensis]|uniref:putative bifunctional diguanylate cyclase/phosphodiesterase n=1 Tax=Aureimonas altamirensis TaxID=370622 RepID=UPI001E3BB812|nr:EAL domain-containing protein [Aureimonas altamirensis]UHD47410.1 EAL domain-containing protein [Aureimonas altamirensis]
MDTKPEGDFDRLAMLASRLFDVPIVLVSLIGRDRQFFKVHIGLDICETSRDVSFCAHAIMQDDILFIPDAAKDPRFSTNPLVLGPPFIRFYAGKPLVTATGQKLGTVCLIDSKPRRSFTSEDRKNLTDLAALVMDRMEIRRLEYVRTVSQARFENIAATSPDAIICSNAEGEITFWNRSAERLFGYSAAEIQKLSGDVIVPDSWRVIYDAELDRLRNGEQMELADRTIELSGLRKDGSEFPAEFSLSTWQEGNSSSVGAIVRDVTERRQNEERLFRLASLDPLTDLPNRAAWRDCLEKRLASGKPATVLLLDLDGFKDVNDTLGHSAGDAVLKDVAMRLTATCETTVMVARLGGDEFAALLPDNSERLASAMAEQLVSVIAQPYGFAGQRIDIGASIGIALSPQHSSRPEELLSAADLALYRAKATGKGRFEVFEPALREVAVARREFEQELRAAFQNGEFELYYQPQVATEDRRLTGAEALMRWNHPERGLLSPSSFIDVLSEKPIVPEIGEWVLTTACAQLVEWRSIVPDMHMGVNLFEAQMRSGRLLETVKKVLGETGLPADALELEIVENILLRNDATTAFLLKSLSETGVGLAFDDYGTGFASLSLLKRYPVSRLKIDRSFVRDVTSDPENAAVVRALLYLGRSFGMEVIAEGVETDEQLSFLRQNKCSQAQGYLFGQPVSAREFAVRYFSTGTA